MSAEAPRTVLVTGASGRMGGAVAQACAATGFGVRAAVRDPRAYAGAGTPVRFDIEDPTTLGPALAGCGALFVMRPPQITAKTPFERLAEAAAAAGVRRVVVGSVRAADKAPLPHRGMETAFQAERFDTTILRPADFMQNFETVHRDDIAERGEIRAPSGHGKSSLIDVADIGACAAVALSDRSTAGRAFELTGPAALSMGEAAAVFSDVLGKPVRHVSDDPIGYWISETRRGRDRATAAVMAALYTAQRLGLAAGVTGDVETLTGRPARTLRAYVERSEAVWR